MSLREMAIGLSQIISTQMEVSRIEQLKQMTTKAEFLALQSKINPIFYLMFVLLIILLIIALTIKLPKLPQPSLV